MRFKSWPRHAFTDTPRKRSALRRKQRMEREALPLFADQIAEEQPSEDQVMANRAKAWSEQEVRDRSARAGKWREARRMIDSMPEDERRAVRRAWDCAPYPADPSYLLSVLHSYSLGRIDLKRPPFPLSRTDASGARKGSLFATSDLFVTILKARDIAEDPDAHPLAERHAAYHHLQAAASSNKDRTEAMRDRVLASELFLRLGELEECNA
ncbi:hypothetical protein [Phaeobacter inhibens]|uniref:hypothetical protein n=1 Tax=Phaeobacter inhibens TaxID=221822 RepID=UPI0021A5DCCA|nr:hypothetical protein [Phaeobacter inhibens]UWR62783.1 hypothetical protein K4F88_19380 [Phaeobacter inhibens]